MAESCYAETTTANSCYLTYVKHGNILRECHREPADDEGNLCDDERPSAPDSVHQVPADDAANGRPG